MSQTPLLNTSTALQSYKTLEIEHIFWYTTGMGYKTAATTCTVQLVALHDLPQATITLCETLRQEAGRCWTDMVQAHDASRSTGHWLTESDLKAMTKGGIYRLHSQSIQALAEKLAANVATTSDLRRQERTAGLVPVARYPYKPKPHQTVTWKEQSIRVQDGVIVLPNGKRQQDLVLPLPERFAGVIIRKAELLWRADHYELALTIEHPPNPPLRREGQTAGCDLGEVNIAAVVTESGDALVVNGRLLRSIKRLRNKRHSTLMAKLARCWKASRRWKRLSRRKARASAKLCRQQRHILHTASHRVVQFCNEHGVSRIAVGDVRDVANGIDKGHKTNQRVSQWAHGQFVRYLTYKAQRQGVSVEQIAEDFSTRTCSCCGHIHSNAPRGRMFRCSGCGSILHRDVNGGANICARALYGQYGRVSVRHITYRRATAVAPRTRARRETRPVSPVAARRL
jgi:putative transposase